MVIEPNQYLSFKALVGDVSDNIDDVKGIGPKTAIELLTKYNSIEGIYENLDQHVSIIQTLLSNDYKKVIVNLDLLKINCNLDINLREKNLKYLTKWKSREIIDRVLINE